MPNHVLASMENRREVGNIGSWQLRWKNQTYVQEGTREDTRQHLNKSMSVDAKLYAQNPESENSENLF